MHFSCKRNTRKYARCCNISTSLISHTFSPLLPTQRREKFHAIHEYWILESTIYDLRTRSSSPIASHRDHTDSWIYIRGVFAFASGERVCELVANDATTEEINTRKKKIRLDGSNRGRHTYIHTCMHTRMRTVRNVLCN